MVVSTLGDSYICLSSQSAGGAANRKLLTFQLPAFFQLLAFETHSIIHSSTLDFLNAVDGQSSAASADPRQASFLWQYISVLWQEFTAMLISETFIDPGTLLLQTLLLIAGFSPLVLYALGQFQ